MRIYGHLFPDSSATIAAYHANGKRGERFDDFIDENVPKNDENPGFPGHS